MIACCAICWEQPRPDIKANCPYLTFHLTGEAGGLHLGPNADLLM